MTSPDLNDLEIAPLALIEQAVRDFAAALAETPEFKAFEKAASAVHHDAAAEQARSAFQAKQQPLQLLLRLSVVSAEDQAELERLRQAYLTVPSVVAYAEAEAALLTMCQETGDLLSSRIGFDFATACASSCC